MKKLSPHGEFKKALPFVLLFCAVSLPYAVTFSIKSVGNTENVVSVSVSKTLPNVAPREAYEAWLDFVWERGGGLPLVFVSTNKANRGFSRMLLPLFAEERLLGETHTNIDNPTSKDEDDDSTIEQEYELTSLGPIWATEIEAGSHAGRVSFVADRSNNEVSSSPRPSTTATTLTWDVTFRTLRRPRLWRTVTESTVSESCENLAAFLREPIVFTKRRRLRTTKSPETLAQNWFDFVWREGGGLPLPLPPASLSDDGRDRMLVPPFLRERVLEQRSTSTTVEVTYEVVNPSLLTAFPVHDHLGRVRLRTTDDDDDDVVEMVWEVCVRPMRGCDAYVRAFTETVIRTLTNNFRTHVEEPDAVVDVFSSRGLAKESTSVIRVRKDSWIGGVLHARSRDERGVWEQTKDLFRPWAWGSTDAIANDDDGASSWSEGDVSDLPL